MTAGYEGLRLPVTVVLDNVRSMYNVGAFFRAADGVGLEKLCLAGITAHPPKSAITKTALGAEDVVPWEHDWDAVRMAEGLRHQGLEIAAIETSSHSVDLFAWQPTFPACVLFGNEVEVCIQNYWKWPTPTSAFLCSAKRPRLMSPLRQGLSFTNCCANIAF